MNSFLSKTTLKVVSILFVFILALFFFNYQSHFKSRRVELEKWKFDVLNISIYTYEVKLKVPGDVEILRPPGLKQLILELNVLGDNGAVSNKICVYYDVPFKERLGSLSLIQLNKNFKHLDCPQVPPASDGMLAFLNGINSLKVNFLNYRLILNFNFYIDQKKSNQKQNVMFEIPIYNLDNGFKHQKFSPLSTKTLASGLSILREHQTPFSIYLGKSTDRFSLGTAIRCREVDKNCQLVGEDRCHQCAFGHYSVVSSQCSEKIGARFCGPNFCGQKLEPACVRGTQIVDADESGICEGNLVPIFNSDQILICQ